jgi:hypothetical protein
MEAAGELDGGFEDLLRFMTNNVRVKHQKGEKGYEICVND